MALPFAVSAGSIELFYRRRKCYFYSLEDFCCYEISKRRIEFETGVAVDDVLPAMMDKVSWYANESVLWVKNFLRWQVQHEKFLISALNSMAKIPPQIRDEFFKYNETIIADSLRKCLETSKIQLWEKYSIHADVIPYLNPTDTLSIPWPNQTQTHPQPQIRAGKMKWWKMILFL